MNGINGNVMFYKKSDDIVLVDINLSGLAKNAKLGFHIHEAGDVTDVCKSACAHFNPFNTVHGGPKSRTRHVGDLGNIITDNNGNCKMKFYDHMIKLDGTISNIIGRSIVIHGKTDDLGRGKDKESLITGNAGNRIACSVIGYSKKMFTKN
jgi:Cu-Zn family superoxide dismutase